MIKRSDLQNENYTTSITLHLKSTRNQGLIVSKSIFVHDNNNERAVIDENIQLAYSKDNLLDVNKDLGFNIVEDL